MTEIEKTIFKTVGGVERCGHRTFDGSYLFQGLPTFRVFDLDDETLSEAARIGREEYARSEGWARQRAPGGPIKPVQGGKAIREWHDRWTKIHEAALAALAE